MRILLIRHGESVDNVAGLYAGSRDSPLTNHGVLQIKRLGTHLAKRHEVLDSTKYIFTSNLQRAYQTAHAIVEAFTEAQSHSSTNKSEIQAPLEVCQLPELREKDYGSSEGKKYGLKVTGNTDSVAQPDSETHDSMKTRVNRFINSHLVPVVDKHVSDRITVIVVAHGIILGVLLKALVERFPPSHRLTTSQSGSQEILPEFAAWSNTGVLQAKIESSKAATLPRSTVSRSGMVPPTDSNETVPHLVVEFSNNLEHLQGLKKTRGGIGSAKFDSRQRTMDSFFGSPKKRKLDETKD
ncbi:phosphoglycerate mutase-like protein [Hypoxylon sp. NC1633]|nr:phosphoglycerate mutase-like protein [Hypoxylon sp. NC1633]